MTAISAPPAGVVSVEACSGAKLGEALDRVLDRLDPGEDRDALRHGRVLMVRHGLLEEGARAGLVELVRACDRPAPPGVLLGRQRRELRGHP
ncbi:MAG: hypothetical protein MSC31_18490 [Solirubrobacteraceae bacterium MAG38_C4-C5]|nr:hypothetical protein [Candidatus Siliceabacter maunaloa]